MWMTRVSIQHPVFATMVMVSLLVLGVLSYQQLRVEAMPDVQAPQVQVWVSYPGASPEQVENDITKPIENAVNTVTGVKRILSRSEEGRSLTWIEFQLDVDTTRVLQETRDKLAQIRAGFPRDARDPVVQRSGGEGEQPVASYALTAEALSLRQLTLLADQVVRKGFERVSGVGRVDVGGTVSRQILVQVEPAKLAAFGVSVEQVVQALRNANVSVPVGSISSATADAIVRVDGRIASRADFERIIVVRKAGAPVYLSQLARVLDGERERDSISRVDGKPAITFWVYKTQDANLIEVGNALKQAATDLTPQLAAGAELKMLWTSADFVERTVNNVKRTIIEGALLTVLIVFLFLGSWRSTVITGLTLPIAVIATFIALHALGFSLNYMTLMALSLCIGLLIDDAIVVRENIVRHLHMGKDHVRAAREGTDEIGLAVLATTFSVVAVFVPIAFMGGMVGRYFHAFGVTVAVAVLVSLFVSFTLDPMLSSVWKDPPGGARVLPVVGPVLRRFDSWVERWHVWYGALLGWVLSGRRVLWRLTTRGVTLLAAVASFAVSIPLAGLLGTELMPRVDESYTSVQLTMPVGSSLEYADERVRRVERALREFPEIASVDTLIGGDDGRNIARLSLRLEPPQRRARSQQEVEEAIRERVARIPGVDLRVGWGGPIYVALLGNDDAEMTRVMTDLKSKLAKIRGVTDIEITVKEGTPALSVRLKPELAAEYGITHARIGATLRALVGGEPSGYWLAPDGQNYEVITQVPRASRTAAYDIAGLNIATGRTLPDGSAEVVPLRSIATVEPTFNPQNIRRQDLTRRVALFADVQGRPAGDVGREVKELVDSYALPPGLRFDVGGQIREQQEVFGSIASALVLAVIFIYIVLASQFGSFIQPLAIMVSLPLAIVGAVLALLVTGTTQNVYTMIGIVFLMGLVTKNAILLVDFANQGQRQGMSRIEALLAAGQVRLRPILMTTAAMIFGMLPLALGLGEGAEQQAPMGRAIIGGVITSTLLTLVVVPVIYSYLDAWAARWRRSGDSGAVALDRQPAQRAD
jgi:hydrophobe/amphiphile efflux-1 (HAE1) family protein